MKSKISKVQIFRHIVQVIMLVLSPGLFILAFGELKNIYEMIASGNFNFIQAVPSLIELITVIFATVLLGRFFCGWICAFGAYNDFLYMISKKIFKINFKVNEKVDSVLKYVKHLILLTLIIVSWTMGSKIFESASPWDAFAQITDFPQVLFTYSIGCGLLVLITIGAIFIERFFCRYLCPLGAVFNLISRISIFNIKKPNDKCGSCRLCTNKCSMGLKLYEKNVVCGGDCINCFKCVDVCPRKNTQANIVGENINPALASSFAIATMTGVYAVTNLAGTALTQNGMASVSNIAVASSISSSTSSSSQSYKDGTYTGTGTGFKGGTTKVSVTVQNGKISSIKTVSSQDTPDFYQRVESNMFNKIISAQSTSVDSISGATYSCKGITSAVQNALKQAVVTASITNDSQNSAATSTTNSGTVANNTTVSESSNVTTGTNNTSSANTGSTNNNNVTSSESTSKSSNAEITSSKNNTSEANNSTNSNSSSNNATGTNNASMTTNNSNSVANSNTNASIANSSAANNTQTANSSTASNKTASSSSASASQTQYKDGTYTGTGTGFKGGKTKIQVTIQDDKITSIKTVSSQDTPNFYSRVESTMFNKIISSQSTSVDTVSGATYSCRGIISAVQSAISQAKA